MASALYVGIKGKVIAMDRTTGRPIWIAPLKGGDFVNVLVDGDRIFASTKGELFCLDAATGKGLWYNDLPGEGLGLITLATAAGSTHPMPSFEETRRREAAEVASADGG